MSMAAKHGCDPTTTSEAIRLSSGSNFYMCRYMASHILAGNLRSGATVEVLQKDVALARDVALAAGINLVGHEDLSALVAACVDTYGKDAP